MPGEIRRRLAATLVFRPVIAVGAAAAAAFVVAFAVTAVSSGTDPAPPDRPVAARLEVAAPVMPALRKVAALPDRRKPVPTPAPPVPAVATPAWTPTPAPSATPEPVAVQPAPAPAPTPPPSFDLSG
jgi:hypothetical protein